MSEFTRQPSMFDREAESEISDLKFENPRQAVIDRVTERAGEAFRAAFRGFVIDHARVTSVPFSAEDLHELYEKLPAATHPRPEKWQAAGGVIQKLVRERHLRQIGFTTSRVHGNPIRIYLKG